MSYLHRHATLISIACILTILLIIGIIVVVKFFTNDEYFESTLSKSSLSNLAEDFEPEIPTEPVKDKSKNTNEIIVTVSDLGQNVFESSSRSAEERTYNLETSVDISSDENAQIQEEPIEQYIEEPVIEYDNEANEEPVEETIEEIFEEPVSLPSIGTIVIPKTGVNLPILSNVSIQGMETAACFLYSTGELNSYGTTIIVSHNYRNGALFSNNKYLEIGDTIYITTNDGNQVQYTIYDKFVTTDNDIDYVFRNTTNEPEIALSTCTDDDVNRLIILAK